MPSAASGRTTKRSSFAQDISEPNEGSVRQDTLRYGWRSIAFPVQPDPWPKACLNRSKDLLALDAYRMGPGPSMASLIAPIAFCPLQSVRWDTSSENTADA
jgi:hypothetical protein